MVLNTDKTDRTDIRWFLYNFTEQNFVLTKKQTKQHIIKLIMEDNNKDNKQINEESQESRKQIKKAADANPLAQVRQKK